MSEHFCKDCIDSDGDKHFPACKHTGAIHTTGIECPSFRQKKEVEMNDPMVDEARKKVQNQPGWYPTEAGRPDRPFVGHPEGVLEVVHIDPHPKEHSAIRAFETGATRDADQGKLDYIKALSPIVLRRYVQYLDKHRLQPDGSYRDFDNWKKGMDQDVYRSSGGRHFMDDWLLSEGYITEDNHGPVTDIEDVLCAKMFNDMGRLKEVLEARFKKEAKANSDRTKPVEGGY